jgi:MYXO-CTERM domain-containing protein
MKTVLGPSLPVGAFLLATLLSTPAGALAIDKILLKTNVQTDDPAVKDITSMVQDGKEFDFDMSTYFPSVFTKKGEGTGFIFIDEDANFGQLIKGLDVVTGGQGQVLNAEIDVYAHWDHADGVVTQEIGVDGTLTVNPPNGVAAVHYYDTLSPFLTDPPGAPVQATLARDVVGTSPVHDRAGPASLLLPAGRIDYVDVLQVGAQDFADSDFIATSSELSTLGTPEPSNWAMTLAGFAALGFARRRASRTRAPIAG